MKITKIAFNIININQIIFLYKKKKIHFAHNSLVPVTITCSNLKNYQLHPG